MNLKFKLGGGGVQDFDCWRAWWWVFGMGIIVLLVKRIMFHNFHVYIFKASPGFLENGNLAIFSLRSFAVQ